MTDHPQEHILNATKQQLPPNITKFMMEHDNKSVDIFINNEEVDAFHAFLMNKWEMSDAHKVKEFTEQSAGLVLPTKPTPMSKKSVQFLIGMMISEMVELAQTVCTNPHDAISLVKECCGKDFNPNYKAPKDDIDKIAQQADALVDSYYYSLNAAAKHGFNLSKVFTRVHAANMAKKFADGTFHRREDGKVIKPHEWEEPNIHAEITDQIANDAF
jgi:predicted HAD superfamily Cof-like phosphohydrolase